MKTIRLFAAVLLLAAPAHAALELGPAGADTNATRTTVDVLWSLSGTNTTSPTVTLYWAAADAGTNAGAWSYSTNLGERAMATYTNRVGALTPSRPWYFRLSAVDATNTAWTTNYAYSMTLSGAPTSPPPGHAYVPIMVGTNGVVVAPTNIVDLVASGVSLTNTAAAAAAAQATAGSALTNAAGAQATANSAHTNADAAQATANTAITNAAGASAAATVAGARFLFTSGAFTNSAAGAWEAYPWANPDQYTWFRTNVLPATYSTNAITSDLLRGVDYNGYDAVESFTWSDDLHGKSGYVLSWSSDMYTTSYRVVSDSGTEWAISYNGFEDVWTDWATNKGPCASWPMPAFGTAADAGSGGFRYRYQQSGFFGSGAGLYSIRPSSVDGLLTGLTLTNTVLFNPSISGGTAVGLILTAPQFTEWKDAAGTQTIYSAANGPLDSRYPWVSIVVPPSTLQPGESSPGVLAFGIPAAMLKVYDVHYYAYCPTGGVSASSVLTGMHWQVFGHYTNGPYVTGGWRVRMAMAPNNNLGNYALTNALATNVSVAGHPAFGAVRGFYVQLSNACPEGVTNVGGVLRLRVGP